MARTERLFVVFIVVAGTAGLLVLQSLLVPREAQATAAGAPLGMFEIGAERGFSSRHLMRAVATLLVLVVLYIALALSLRGVPPYLSMALYSVVLLFVYAAAEVQRKGLAPDVAGAPQAGRAESPRSRRGRVDLLAGLTLVVPGDRASDHRRR